MNERAIRQGIVDGLRAAHVPGARDAALMQAFIEGRADPALDALDMDSLGAMELCIHLELHSGASLAPDAVRAMPSLGALAQALPAAMTARPPGAQDHGH